MRTLLLIPVLASLAACAPTLEAPNVPNPVLLGPVDRVGGHRAGPAKEVGKRIDKEVELSVSGSSGAATGIVTGVATKTPSRAVEVAMMEGTQGRPDRDVRVDEIPAGAYALIAGGAFFMNEWVGVKGRVVEVRRGN